jgi:hypothetical protein
MVFTSVCAEHGVVAADHVPTPKEPDLWALAQQLTDTMIHGISGCERACVTTWRYEQEGESAMGRRVRSHGAIHG